MAGLDAMMARMSKLQGGMGNRGSTAGKALGMLAAGATGDVAGLISAAGQGAAAGKIGDIAGGVQQAVGALGGKPRIGEPVVKGSSGQPSLMGAQPVDKTPKLMSGNDAISKRFQLSQQDPAFVVKNGLNALSQMPPELQQQYAPDLIRADMYFDRWRSK
jgi:hypothetical protein